MDNTQFETKENKIQIKDKLNQNSWGGGGTPLQEANGDVPRDGATFSRLD